MEQVATRRWSIATFGLTTLVSAFLLFQVQPLISKAILPWFGGCPAVWTTCMLFFQVVLFAGYMYAHLLQEWLPPKRQVVFHLILVVVAAALLPIAPSDSWKPTPASNPTWQILLLLLATVGLPYFALSATSPLVQAWFSRACPDRSPYRLYALSNFGSLAALLSYPFVFEPAFNLRTQSTLWSVAFVLYAFLCAATLVALRRTISPLPLGEGPGVMAEQGTETSTLQTNNSPIPSPTWLDRLRWLALPAFASLFLLAATNHICQDVATVPFLWVMPLSLYLLSFIICFEHERYYIRRFWAAGLVFALTGLLVMEHHKQTSHPPLAAELALNFAVLFFACMVCHGELARLKPNPRRLTEYYLMISAGGALGGLFVAVVAPLIFCMYTEWYIGIIASALLGVGLVILPRYAGRRGIIIYVVVAPLLAFIAAQGFAKRFESEPPLDRTRNFFGVVTVQEEVESVKVKSPSKEDPDATTEEIVDSVVLINGRIRHGCQFVDPAKHRWPTSYYGESSGVGRAILFLQKSGPVRVGAIGLGVGTLAAYGKAGDVFRFYEINPEVLRMAREHFTYLSDCPGKTEIVMGDARLSLEAEAKTPLKYSVLVIDAFSGDAIPTHLLTREAFDVYKTHLAPGGIIAVHVSNHYLRLSPVVRRLAENVGMRVSRISDDGVESRLQSSSTWVLVTQNDAFLKAHPSDPRNWGDDNVPAPLWTDQYSNLFQILKYR